jgi:hypothetical protein
MFDPPCFMTTRIVGEPNLEKRLRNLFYSAYQFFDFLCRWLPMFVVVAQIPYIPEALKLPPEGYIDYAIVLEQVVEFTDRGVLLSCCYCMITANLGKMLLQHDPCNCAGSAEETALF